MLDYPREFRASVDEAKFYLEKKNKVHEMLLQFFGSAVLNKKLSTPSATSLSIVQIIFEHEDLHQGSTFPRRYVPQWRFRPLPRAQG